MTAVLLIIFNRPDTTAQVLEAIRKAKPERLYVAADGWRTMDERTKCEKTRRIVENGVDWSCDLRMLQSDRNLGCRHGPSNAIYWFFEHEPEGIILEDDCLPVPSFFRYCAELLEYYRDNNRIMCISGNNFQPSGKQYKDSYYFSNYPHTWGWATWARAWSLNDAKMQNYSDCLKILPSISQFPGFTEFWKNSLEEVRSKGLEAWDYLWLLSCWREKGLTCTPRVNLVSNIGFGPDSTHCPDPNSHWANRPHSDIDFPLRHPTELTVDTAADDYVSKNMFLINSWYKKNVQALSI